MDGASRRSRLAAMMGRSQLLLTGAGYAAPAMRPIDTPLGELRRPCSAGLLGSSKLEIGLFLSRLT